MWICCPHCQRRCAKLYCGRQGFLCRKCYGLPYYSQQCGKVDGLVHKMHKLEQKTLTRPMREKTREKLVEDLLELDDEIDRLIYERAANG